MRHTLFSDVFGESGDDYQEFSKKVHTGTDSLVSSSKDVYISNCLFHDCTSDSGGGAVSFHDSSLERTLIEDTAFRTCKTTYENGGGIQFSNPSNNCNCVISRTCSFNCSSLRSAETEGQYAYVLTYRYNDYSFRNEVNETAISGIKKVDGTRPKYALCLFYSNIKCSSINITNNECYSSPTLYCNPKDEDKFCTCSIMYASIVNNSAKESSGCIFLDNKYSTQLILSSYIIDNKQKDKSDGATIKASGNLFINESFVIGNEGNTVFSDTENYKKITITNCSLDNDITTSKRYTGSFIIVSSMEYSFIDAASHIVTGKCDSFFNSNEKKQRISCLHKKINDMLLTFFQCLSIMALLLQN